jgi:hypothetical protein
MWNAAINLLNENLRNSEKTEQEKQEAINRLRATFGKEPKEFKERTGGKR